MKKYLTVLSVFVFAFFAINFAYAQRQAPRGTANQQTKTTGRGGTNMSSRGVASTSSQTPKTPKTSRQQGSRASVNMSSRTSESTQNRIVSSSTASTSTSQKFTDYIPETEIIIFEKLAKTFTPQINLFRQDILSRQTQADEEFAKSIEGDISECTKKFNGCMKSGSVCGENYSLCATLNYDEINIRKANCESVLIDCGGITVSQRVWENFLIEFENSRSSNISASRQKELTKCDSEVDECMQSMCKGEKGVYSMCYDGNARYTYRQNCMEVIERCELIGSSAYDKILIKIEKAKSVEQNEYDAWKKACENINGKFGGVGSCSFEATMKYAGGEIKKTFAAGEKFKCDDSTFGFNPVTGAESKAKQTTAIVAGAGAIVGGVAGAIVGGKAGAGTLFKSKEEKAVNKADRQANRTAKDTKKAIDKDARETKREDNKSTNIRKDLLKEIQTSEDEVENNPQHSQLPEYTALLALIKSANTSYATDLDASDDTLNSKTNDLKKARQAFSKAINKDEKSTKTQAKIKAKEDAEIQAKKVAEDKELADIAKNYAETEQEVIDYAKNKDTPECKEIMSLQNEIHQFSPETIEQYQDKMTKMIALYLKCEESFLATSEETNTEIKEKSEAKEEAAKKKAAKTLQTSTHNISFRKPTPLQDERNLPDLKTAIPDTSTLNTPSNREEEKAAEQRATAEKKAAEKIQQEKEQKELESQTIYRTSQQRNQTLADNLKELENDVAGVKNGTKNANTVLAKLKTFRMETNDTHMRRIGDLINEVEGIISSRNEDARLLASRNSEKEGITKCTSLKRNPTANTAYSPSGNSCKITTCAENYTPNSDLSDCVKRTVPQVDAVEESGKNGAEKCKKLIKEDCEKKGLFPGNMSYNNGNCSGNCIDWDASKLTDRFGS